MHKICAATSMLEVASALAILRLAALELDFWLQPAFSAAASPVSPATNDLDSIQMHTFVLTQRYRSDFGSSWNDPPSNPPKNNKRQSMTVILSNFDYPKVLVTQATLKSKRSLNLRLSQQLNADSNRTERERTCNKAANLTFENDE
eukprot:4048249-Amphidinium_carterae.1